MWPFCARGHGQFDGAPRVLREIDFPRITKLVEEEEREEEESGGGAEMQEKAGRKEARLL